MDDISWITGLMAHNTDALGFIPDSRIASWYIPRGCYVLQRDERGNNVGYILHGLPQPGRIMTIQQHCIDFDKRLRGYGEQALSVVIGRAQANNVRTITLHCAADLNANLFWRSAGFELTGVLAPRNRRNRAINVYTLDLWPTLFT